MKTRPIFTFVLYIFQWSQYRHASHFHYNFFMLMYNSMFANACATEREYTRARVFLGQEQHSLNAIA